METQQALIAIGGKASRLRSGGLEVGRTKSFLEITGEPLLFWCLKSLATAGISRIVLAGDQNDYLTAAEQIIESQPLRFEDVQYFKDPGLGVHGLPYQARNLLEESFFFECGHGISKPSHYSKMDTIKDSRNVVFSAFHAHPDNQRQQVILKNQSVKLAVPPEASDSALAHPMLLDQRYAETLPALDFNITKIIGYYAASSELKYVWNEMPPEFDTMSEYLDAENLYSQVLAT
jgi:hypothetical protein